MLGRLSVWSCCFASMLCAQVPVARLTGGFGEDCLLYRQRDEPVVCAAPRLLYPGDELETARGIQTMHIQWFAPPETFGIRKSRTRLKVGFRAPKDPTRLLALARKAFPDAFNAAREAEVELRSQGPAKAVASPLPPGQPSALLPGYPVPFRSQGGTSTLTLVDTGGRVILQRTFEGELSVPPEDLGLRPGQSGEWRTTGPRPEAGRFRVVEASAAQGILAGMRTLEPVAAGYYLRWVEAAHPELGRFGWLCRKLLQGDDSALGRELVRDTDDKS